MSLIRQATQTVRKLVLRRINLPQITETRNIKRWVAPTLHELYKRRQKIGPEPLKPRSTFLEWNYEAELYAFGKRLGEDFNKSMLKQALTHRSYVNQKRDEAKEKSVEIPYNKNLIKEGSELISRYVIDELSKKHPDEGVQALHDYLTNEELLSHVAKHMGLTDIVLTSEFPVENSTLADTFKAVVAALKNSQNQQRANLFIRDFLLSHLMDKDVFDIWSLKEPMDYLQNLLKKKGIEDIEPRLCHHSATNTILANFQVGLYTNKKLLGIGWGESIEIAKETAALDAIYKIHYGK